MNNWIKEEIKWANEVYKTFIKYGKTQNDYFKLQGAISFVSCLTGKLKNEYAII